MNKSLTEQRMITNEGVFRHHNEQVQKQMDALRAIAKEDNQEHLIPEHDIPLHFYCECSDEDCRQRIELLPSRYNAIHRDRKCFIVMPGHEAALVERVVKHEKEYSIVRKHETPPESVGKLQPTPLENN
jgi:hypothetical protein